MQAEQIQNASTDAVAETQPSVFSSQFRVYYEDTDAGGIVYHTNYLKFCERTRTDFVREVLGYSQQKHLQEDKHGFVLAKLRANFMSSAKLEDLLTVTCVPFHLTRARLEMYQEIRNEQGKLLFAMCSTLAFVDGKTGRPLSIPEEFKQKLVPHVWTQDPQMFC